MLECICYCKYIFVRVARAVHLDSRDRQRSHHADLPFSASSHAGIPAEMFSDRTASTELGSEQHFRFSNQLESGISGGQRDSVEVPSASQPALRGTAR